MQEAMASKMMAMVSNPIAMASTLARAMASNQIAKDQVSVWHGLHLFCALFGCLIAIWACDPQILSLI